MSNKKFSETHLLKLNYMHWISYFLSPKALNASEKLDSYLENRIKDWKKIPSGKLMKMMSKRDRLTCAFEWRLRYFGEDFKNCERSRKINVTEEMLELPTIEEIILYSQNHKSEDFQDYAIKNRLNSVDMTVKNNSTSVTANLKFNSNTKSLSPDTAIFKFHDPESWKGLTILHTRDGYIVGGQLLDPAPYPYNCWSGNVDSEINKDHYPILSRNCGYLLDDPLIQKIGKEKIFRQ